MTYIITLIALIHLFLARQLTPVPAPVAGDDDEDIEVVLMQPEELDAALASGDEYRGC